RDWEIMNKPAKGFVVPRAFFTLRVNTPEKPSIIKVLQGPVGGSYVGEGHSLVSSHDKNELGQGLPHFRKATFIGTFPIATLKLEDPDVPVRVILEAFNPFIPLNDKDSSIPVAFFIYNFENTSDKKISATVYGNLTNIIGDQGSDGRVNEARKEGQITGLYLTNAKVSVESPKYGSMVLATTSLNSSVWTRWKDARLSKFWEILNSPEGCLPKEAGGTDTGTVAVNITIEPRGKAQVVFILAWHFPNYEQFWAGSGKHKKAVWKNYYATLWKDAWDVAKYSSLNFERLLEETRLFRNLLFSSTLPAHVLDAVSSQLSTLKSTTCLRLEDGTFYGFEGSSNTCGCCEGSCTHVWNYAQALPYLFPNLQRSMLEAHFANSVENDGFMTFRMPLPLGTKAKPYFHPAADGQMGTVLQVYREWLISGDERWLRSVWPTAKKLIEFAWKYWDADRDGVMEGMQHNTYDIEFYGPNTMMGSLYLAALRAAQKIAEHFGEKEEARKYLRIFKKGSRWMDENLFNGEYYEQKVNPNAHLIWPKHYQELTEKHGKDDIFKEWPKWQFGKGCLSDQMIGQWYLHMLDLGYLYKPTNVKKALRSIFKYNWKPDLSNHPCLLRIYAVNDEAGLVICTWPRGERPGYAFYFADEVWCGIEYQVASHMIYEGMIKEGLSISKGVRDRHRGDRRNPWDEFECGHHYARSMASYALLLALTGYKCLASKKRLGFVPKIYQKDFRTFFSTATGWGLYAHKIGDNEATFNLELKYGSLNLDTLELPKVNAKRNIAEATLDNKKIMVDVKRDKKSIEVILGSISIKKGQTLKITIR
ncbi:hypothetical protein KEJ18_05145, partial [Candidatus Bathyarchaeota archaeon]|nr:hypothetical protein [Candidatus Bathyarchaeota archaeon]